MEFSSQKSAQVAQNVQEVRSNARVMYFPPSPGSSVLVMAFGAQTLTQLPQSVQRSAWNTILPR